MTTQSENKAGRSSPWYTHPISVLVGLIFFTYIVLNAIMVWVSLTTAPDLVSESYYEDSRQFDEVIQARAASQQTGWHAELAPQRELDGTLRLRVTDSAGQPVAGLQGTIKAYRPSDAGQDHTMQWRELDGQPGNYAIQFDAKLPRGLWEVNLNLRSAAGTLYVTHRVVLP